MRTTPLSTTETTLYRYRCEVCGQRGRGLVSRDEAAWAGAKHARTQHRRAVQRLLFAAWTIEESTALPHARGAWTWSEYDPDREVTA